jgi:hypothetical protein
LRVTDGTAPRGHVADDPKTAQRLLWSSQVFSDSSSRGPGMPSTS